MVDAFAGVVGLVGRRVGRDRRDDDDADGDFGGGDGAAEAEAETAAVNRHEKGTATNTTGSPADNVEKASKSSFPIYT